MIMDERFARYLRPMAPQPTGLMPSGRLPPQLRCILFDVYGTLLISGSGDIGVSGEAALKVDAVQRLMDDFRLTGTPAELRRRFHAAIADEHRRLKRAGIDHPEVVVESIWAAVLQHSDLESVRRFALEYELIANPVYPMPNLNRLLRICRKNDIVLGIISNAQFYTPLLLSHFLSASLAQAGFDADLLQFSFAAGSAKPSTIMFNNAANILLHKEISLHSTLYVGNDMRNDILPAHQAGFATALFAGDRRSLRLRKDDPQCAAVSPDLVVTDLKQLVP